MHLVFDRDVTVEAACAVSPESSPALRAAEAARDRADTLWLYAGTNASLLADATCLAGQRNPELSPADAHAAGRVAVARFSRRCQWLAALASDLEDAFDCDDPQHAQLLRAVERLGPDARILTRDPQLLAHETTRALEPESYLETEPVPPPVAFIDLAAQQHRIRGGLERRLHAVLHHGHYIMGPEIAELETALAEYVGSSHCLACSSGTDALLLGLMALGAGPGDAVFCPSFTFVATAETVAVLGAEPVFVDIDPDTYNLDPAGLTEAIRRVRREGRLTPRGVVPVDLFGVPADHAAIGAVAEEHGLWVLDDGAQAFGAALDGMTCPAFGEIGATSFFPAKPLGAYGDAGAVFTDDATLHETMLSLRIHGMGDDRYNNVRIGLNARMDSLQAAVLIEKLRLLPEEIDRRNRVAEGYIRDLAALPDLKLPRVPEGMRSTWAQFCVQSNRRTEIQDALKAAAIPSPIYYPRPLHMQHAFAYLGCGPGSMPVSERAAERIFALPMHPYLDDRTRARVVETIASVLST